MPSATFDKFTAYSPLPIYSWDKRFFKLIKEDFYGNNQLSWNLRVHERQNWSKRIIDIYRIYIAPSYQFIILTSTIPMEIQRYLCNIWKSVNIFLMLEIHIKLLR